MQAQHKFSVSNTWNNENKIINKNKCSDIGEIMIRSFLLDYRQELLEKKIDYTKLLHKNELKIKETMEFIHLINLSEDKSYESFSPQNYNRSENEKRIKELKKEKNNLKETGNQLVSNINELDQKIEQLDHIISLVKKNEIEDNERKKEIDKNEIVRLKLLETVEKEKQKISEELYCTVVESLTGMAHKIDTCIKLLDVDSKRCKLELQNISKSLSETINETKRTVDFIYPESMDKIDNLIKREIEKLQESNKVKISYQIKGNSDKVLPIVNLTLFRIIQQSCTNAIRNLDTKNISLKLIYHLEQIELSLSTDGSKEKISNIENMDNQTDIDLNIYKVYEKVYLLSGSMDIELKKNRTINLYITLPITQRI